MAAPRVSVVMGAYNGERFLRPAIEGILNQTYRDFELIVVDDCSTDGTLQILEEFKDERMRVVRNQRNLGIRKPHFIRKFKFAARRQPRRHEPAFCHRHDLPGMSFGILIGKQRERA